MNSDMLRVLKGAMDSEKDGFKTHLKYAIETTSADGKNMYINLAMDEHNHVLKLHTKLTQMVAELLKNTRFQPDNIEEILAYQESSESEVPIQTVVPKEETAILEMAIENEISSKKFYTELAEKSDGPIFHALYSGLAKEEERHEVLLKAELDCVKGNGYWFDFREFTLEAP